jgi:membrane-associated PAP2 superfamily phosphatase
MHKMSARIALLLAASALAILWLGAYTNIDLILAHRLFDASGTFPLRHAWLTERLGHIYLRNVLTVMALGVIAAALIDAWRPRAGWSRPFRLRLRVLALSAVLVPLVISLLKQASTSHCPWDLAEFGGTEVYVRLLQSALPGASAGRCMPGGHASSGLWLIALTVFWLPQWRRTAAVVFGVTLSFGFFLGWMQQLRGAHFLTHTLWSMWIACAVVSAVAWAVMRVETLRTRKSVLGVEPVAQIVEGQG